MEKIKSLFYEHLFQKFGFSGIIRVVFYPFTLLISNPINLIISLWRCRVLLNGNWGDYSNFNSSGLNALFYRSAAINLYKYGKSGSSPYMGLGNFPLVKVRYFTLASLYSYWIGGCVPVLIGMASWIFFHFLWIGQTDYYWLILILTLAVFSTSFYMNILYQNYNILGWCLLPLALYGMTSQNWPLTAVAWFLASFGSVTVIVVGIILSATLAVAESTLLPIITTTPAMLKLSLSFIPVLTAGTSASSPLITITKAIGFTKSNVKYKFVATPGDTVLNIYLFFLYAQFLLCCFFTQGAVPALAIAAVGIFALNTFFRFADRQSIYIVILSVFATVLLETGYNLALLASFWIAVSPIPMMLLNNALDSMPVFTPFYVRGPIKEMENFFSTVGKNSKILMAYENPENNHDKVFDGYRILLELPLYVATKREFLIIPNWWAVYELNYEGAPEFWGRDVNSVLNNVRQWKTDYVIIYQEESKELDPVWEKNNFKPVATFHWSDFSERFKNDMPTKKPLPSWFLLKPPAEV